MSQFSTSKGRRFMLHSWSRTTSPWLLTQRTSRVLWPWPHGTEHYEGTRHKVHSDSVNTYGLKKYKTATTGKALVLKLLTWTAGCYSVPVTYCSPLWANLPLAADLQLAGAGSFWPLQVLAVACVDIECAVGVNLTTQDLPMLHAEPAGFAAFWPLSNVPTA